jgi:mannan endo-1,4-beta-mannosidase
MKKERIFYSLFISVIIIIYPVLYSVENISNNVDSDEYIKLGFSVENNTLYNLKLVEKGIGRRVDIFHVFQKINETPKLETFQEALDEGYTVLLTLEPWDGVSDNKKKYSPASIINGSIDSDIDKWARALNDLNFDKGDFIIRTMHEINGNWYPWSAYAEKSSPEQSKLAFIHFTTRFKKNNNKTLFMFGINFRGNRYSDGNIEYIYNVGETLLDDKYYDIIGISGYNRVSKYHEWKTFSELYDPIYSDLKKRTNKPIWIAEISSVSREGDKAEWIRDMFYQVKNNYPNIDSIVWFDENKVFLGEVMDWAYDSTPESGFAFREAVRSENMKKKEINVGG